MLNCGTGPREASVSNQRDKLVDSGPSGWLMEGPLRLPVIAPTGELNISDRKCFTGVTVIVVRR